MSFGAHMIAIQATVAVSSHAVRPSRWKSIVAHVTGYYNRLCTSSKSSTLPDLEAHHHYIVFHSLVTVTRLHHNSVNSDCMRDVPRIFMTNEHYRLPNATCLEAELNNKSRPCLLASPTHSRKRAGAIQLYKLG